MHMLLIPVSGAASGGEIRHGSPDNKQCWEEGMWVGAQWGSHMGAPAEGGGTRHKGTGLGGPGRLGLLTHSAILQVHGKIGSKRQAEIKCALPFVRY